MIFHLNPAAFPPGWTGVDLFFVLSGYLITNIILKYQQSPRFLLAFYARRGLRIWPIYYLVFILLIAINPFLPKPYALDAWPFYATYTQNLPSYWGGHMPPFNPAFDHTWTLAIEEQYYLLWPALVMLAGPRRCLPLCLAVIALAFVAREGFAFYFVVPVVRPAMSERLLIARCDGFALGGLLAVLFREPLAGRLPLRQVCVLGAALVVGGGYLAIAFATGGPGALGLPTPGNPALTILMVGLFYFSVVGFVLLGSGRPILAALRWKPLCDLGVISYGLYMYHYVIYWMIDGFGANPDDFNYHQPWPVSAAKVLLTIAVAIVSWHCVEKPIMRLKGRFEYQNPSA